VCKHSDGSRPLRRASPTPNPPPTRRPGAPPGDPPKRGPPGFWRTAPQLAKSPACESDFRPWRRCLGPAGPSWRETTPDGSDVFFTPRGPQPPRPKPTPTTSDRGSEVSPPTLRVVVTSCETNPMDRMFFTPRGPRQPRTKTTCTTSGRDLEGSEPNRRVVASSCETFPDGSSPAGAAPSPSPIIRPADRRP
jgi:hypothetical protein